MRVPVPWRPSIDAVKEVRMELSQCKALGTSSRASMIITVTGRPFVKGSSDFAGRFREDCNGFTDPCLCFLHVVEERDIRPRVPSPIACQSMARVTAISIGD
jgi:hypothetical protein